MPLEILLVLVVGGIAGIALALHLQGRSARLVLDDAGARAGWLRHFPDERVEKVILGRDGHAAMIRAAGGCGVVWSMGADTAARTLSGSQLRETGAGLHIHTGDPGAPVIRLILTPDERSQWQQELARS